MKKILGTCLLIPMLLLAACNPGGTSGPATEGQATADAATVEATEAATPTIEATTEAITDTTGMGETGGLTGTESLTDTEEMTGSDMLTGTEEMTGSESLTDTEEMTGTDGMSDTGSVSGAGVTGSTGITGTEGMSETAGVQAAPRQLILASELQDYNVENAQGDSLGSVDDLVLNLENGQVLLVTLKYGGILGIGDKTFPIPLSAFRFDQETADIPAAPAAPGAVVTDTNAITGTGGMMGTDAMTGTDGMTGTGELPGAMTDSVVVGTRLILDIPEETFENAPGIDEDMNLTDPATVGDMETFYRDLGEDVIGRPIAETNLDDLTGRVIKLSDLDGANVNNPDGDGVGEIDDILVNLRAGRVEYFILSFGGFLGIGDNLYAIPMDAFRVIPTSADVENGSPTLVLDVTEEQLQNAPVFNADDLTSSDWDMDAQNFWMQTR